MQKRKIFALLLGITMLASALTACGDDPVPGEGNGESGSSVQGGNQAQEESDSEQTSGSGSQEGTNASISETCTKVSPKVRGMLGLTSAMTVFADLTACAP